MNFDKQKKTKWSKIVKSLSKKEGGESLALIRICLSLTILFTVFWLIYCDVPDAIWFDHKSSGYRNLGAGTHLIKKFGLLQSVNAYFILYGLIVSTLLMLFGVFGRMPILVTLVLYLNVCRINSESTGASDLVVTNALWLLFLAGANKSLSLSHRIKTGSFFNNKEIYAWPRYLIIFQMVVIYWSTGIQKVSIYWQPIGDFSALYYIMQQPSWWRFDNTWSAYFFPMTQLGTITTWLWEVTSPFLIVALYLKNKRLKSKRLIFWFQIFDFRVLWASIGLLFHILIALLMVVGPFSPAMMSLYFALFKPYEWRNVLKYVGLK